jgi:hypothetical protein
MERGDALLTPLVLSLLKIVKPHYNSVDVAFSGEPCKSLCFVITCFCILLNF